MEQLPTLFAEWSPWLGRNLLGMIAVAFAVVALVTALKHSLSDLGFDLEKPIPQLVLRWSPLLIGAVLGLIPGAWAAETTVGVGALLGLIGGANATMIVYKVARKWFPGLLSTTDSRKKK